MRTLILSCSSTKRKDGGLLPAVDRYDGPAYRTLRANLDQAGPLRVLILSAEFGLIAADTPIADYDRRMTPARARELAHQVGGDLNLLEQRGELGDAFVFAGETYRACLQQACLEHDYLGAEVLDSFTFTRGGIGEQLGQLKAFLNS